MSDGDDAAELTQRELDEIYAAYGDERKKLIDGASSAGQSGGQ